ncbi:hypothetical protein B0H13DRAFT_1862073 [Mycena leptocephala]|nr:hypothetical protein B0H13DRAFT_1862073 [Mycena leptocephala]
MRIFRRSRSALSLCFAFLSLFRKFHLPHSPSQSPLAYSNPSPAILGRQSIPQQLALESKDCDAHECFGPPPTPTVTSKNTDIARLMNEYRNIRRDIADTAARGVLIEDRLRVLGVVEQSLNSADLSAQLRRAEQNLKEERRQLKISEGILQDVQRECKAPVMVPELLMMVE